MVLEHHFLVETATFKKFHRSAFWCQEHTPLNEQAHISEVVVGVVVVVVVDI